MAGWADPVQKPRRNMQRSAVRACLLAERRPSRSTRVDGRGIRPYPRPADVRRCWRAMGFHWGGRCLWARLWKGGCPRRRKLLLLWILTRRKTQEPFGLSTTSCGCFLFKEPHSQPGEAHGHCWFVGLHETTPPGRERSVSEWRDMPRSSAKAAHDDGCVPVLSNAHPTCEIPVWPVRWRVARVWGPGRSQDARDGGPVR